MAKCIFLNPLSQVGSREMNSTVEPGKCSWGHLLWGGGYRKKDEAEGEVNEDEAAAKVSVDPCEAVHLEEPSLP